MFEGGQLWYGDFGDPHLVNVDGTYYAYGSPSAGRVLPVLTSTKHHGLDHPPPLVEQRAARAGGLLGVLRCRHPGRDPRGPGGASPMVTRSGELWVAYAFFWPGERRAEYGPGTGRHPRRLILARMEVASDGSLTAVRRPWTPGG